MTDFRTGNVRLSPQHGPPNNIKIFMTHDCRIQQHHLVILQCKFGDLDINFDADLFGRNAKHPLFEILGGLGSAVGSGA